MRRHEEQRLAGQAQLDDAVGRVADDRQGDAGQPAAEADDHPACDAAWGPGGPVQDQVVAAEVGPIVEAHLPQGRGDSPPTASHRPDAVQL